jgi:hypothetical protein
MRGRNYSLWGRVDSGCDNSRCLVFRRIVPIKLIIPTVCNLRLRTIPSLW